MHEKFWGTVAHPASYTDVPSCGVHTVCKLTQKRSIMTAAATYNFSLCINTVVNCHSLVTIANNSCNNNYLPKASHFPITMVTGQLQ